MHHQDSWIGSLGQYSVEQLLLVSIIGDDEARRLVSCELEVRARPHLRGVRSDASAREHRWLREAWPAA